MSDKKVTSLYLVTSLALMICLLLAYFSKPSVSKCLVRPFIGGVLYNLHITIILVKSNKLLKVFHSNTRATSNKVMKVSLAQIFTVLVSILIACAIIISVLMRHRSEVMQELDIKSHSRILYCSTGFHTNIVIVYLLCVQITCIQVSDIAWLFERCDECDLYFLRHLSCVCRAISYLLLPEECP